MIKSRYAELMRTGGALTCEEVLQGWHFCPDWDYLLVGPRMPEKKSCGCKRVADFDWEADLKAAANRSSLPLSLSRTILLALAEIERLRSLVTGLERELESVSERDAGEDL